MTPARAPKACPHCWSTRAHRSHRRTSLERLLYQLGAEIRRCRDCSFRHAAFGSVAIPLGDHQTAVKHTIKQWAGVVVLCSGLALCIVLVLWVIRRLTGTSG